MPSLSLFSSSSASTHSEPQSRKLSMTARISNSRRLRRKNTDSATSSSYHAPPAPAATSSKSSSSNPVSGWLSRSSTSATKQTKQTKPARPAAMVRRNTDENGMLKAREPPTAQRKHTPINYERRSTTMRQIGGSIRGLGSQISIASAPAVASQTIPPPPLPPKYPVASRAPGGSLPNASMPSIHKLPRAPSIEHHRRASMDHYNSHSGSKSNDTFDAITARIGYHDSLPKPSKRPHSLGGFLKEQPHVPQPVVTRNYRVPLDTEFEPQQLLQRPQSTRSGPPSPSFMRTNSEESSNSSYKSFQSTVTKDIKRLPSRRVTDPVIPQQIDPRSRSLIRRTLTDSAYPLDDEEDGINGDMGTGFHAVTADHAIPTPATNFDGIIEKFPEDSPARQPDMEDGISPANQSATTQRVRRNSSSSSSFMGGWKLSLSRQNTQKSQKSHKSHKSQKTESEKSSGASTSSGQSGEESTSFKSRISGTFSRPGSSGSDKVKNQPVMVKSMSATKAYRQAQNAFLASKAKVKTEEVLPTTTETKQAQPVASLVHAYAHSRTNSDSKASVMSESKESIAESTSGQRNLDRESARLSLVAKLQDVEAQLSCETKEDDFPLPRVVSEPSSLPTPPTEDEPPAIGPVSLENAVKQYAMLSEKLAHENRPITPPDSRDGSSNRSSNRSSSETSTTDEEIFEDAKDVVTPLVTPLLPPKLPSKGTRSPTTTISPSSSGSTTPTTSLSSNRRRMMHRPGPPPGHRSHRKDKSISPLRNEVDTTASDHQKTSYFPSSSSSSSASAKTTSIRRSELRGLERHSIASFPTARGSSSTGPPTPPKPIAKLFVICCRCKYWHDLPSAMYRGMVENGGATRCPYCLHGMETACCSGYTCVVYMHQKHH
ncbi:hypothetical protein EX30DRAFT_212682 [Ascodesmis nigricans]|uniref:Uncharacterized protein n=1 Tax=Ascodesmis nigricans TaxID=341454 RepID=A0A4S2MP77_9PEZI|nr:hypothetical protein EX30DRAFT_212682 [Ascodesmis nigricans]